LGDGTRHEVVISKLKVIFHFRKKKIFPNRKDKALFLNELLFPFGNSYIAFLSSFLKEAERMFPLKFWRRVKRQNLNLKTGRVF